MLDFIFGYIFGVFLRNLYDSLKFKKRNKIDFK